MLLYNFQNAQRVYLGNLDVSKIFLGSSEIFSSIQGDPYSNYVTLLAHFNTDFSDSSTNSYELTGYGNTNINTTIYKFGEGAVYFDGVEDYIIGPEEGILNFGSNSFTIEGWVYPLTFNTQQTIINTYQSIDNSGFEIALNQSTGQYVFRAFGVTGFVAVFNIAPTLNQWNHFAIVYNNSNNTFRCFNNGVINDVAYSSIFSVNTNVCYIGATFDGITFNNFLSGYLDDIRVTNGIPRYTSNFTPPTQQFPAPSEPYGENVSLLLHMNDVSGSRVFVDSSTNNVPMLTSFALLPNLQNFNNVIIDNNIKKFGNGSAFFDGSQDILTTAVNDLFKFNNDFTIEMWIYPLSFNSRMTLFDNGLAFGPGVTLWLEGTTGGYMVVDGGTIIGTSVTSPTLNQWNHVALVRTNGVIKVFNNGIEVLSAAYNTNFTSGLCIIGATIAPNLNDLFYAFYGYIDEFRITKGVARYTSNFIPQTAPFANPDPWSSVLNSSYGSNIIAAYDFRDYNGTEVISKIGPNLQTSNIIVTEDGLTFTKGNNSWAFANSTVACSYPFTMVYVANTDNTISTPSIENVLINCSTTRFGSDMIVFTRTSQSLMPYNGQDNQQTNYLPNGSEWYFYAVSFLNNGTCRFATRKLSGSLNGLVNANNGSTFNGYPGVATGFGDGNQSLYGTTGTYRLAMFINQAFSTENDMIYLFNTIVNGPAQGITLT